MSPGQAPQYISLSQRVVCWRFIERYRRDEHGEVHRRAIAQALWLKATSSERSWVREKIGDEHLPQEEKASVGSVDEASPYDKAVAVLAKVSSVKKLNKKFFKQFKKVVDRVLKRHERARAALEAAVNHLVDDDEVDHDEVTELRRHCRLLLRCQRRDAMDVSGTGGEER